jgi:hypothetical protein
MAHIIRVRTYDPEWRGHITSIYKRGFFGDKLLYKYVICPVRFRHEVRIVFQLLFNYKW